MPQAHKVRPGFLENHFQALSIRNYRRYLAARWFSMVGMWIQGPIIAWLVFAETGSTEALGTVQFLGQLPMMMLVMAAGVVADRHARRNMVIFTQTGMMVLAFVMGVLLASGRLGQTLIYVLFAFAFVNGVIRAFDVPARQAFIMDLAGGAALGNAIALRSATFNFARILGPAIGGYILVKFGPATCFFTKAVLFVPILVTLATLGGMGRGPLKPKTKGLADLAEGLRHIWTNRKIFHILLLWGAFSIFGRAYFVLLASFAKEIYGKEATEYGLLLSVQGIGALAAALVIAATSRRRRPQKWAIAGLGMVVAALLALSITSSYIVALLCVGLLGFGFVSFTISSDTLLQLLTEDRFRGRVMGARTFVFGGFAALGAVLAGTTAGIDAVGPRWTVAGGAALVAAASFLLGPRILRIDISGNKPSVEPGSEDG